MSVSSSVAHTLIYIYTDAHAHGHTMHVAIDSEMAGKRHSCFRHTLIHTCTYAAEKRGNWEKAAHSLAPQCPSISANLGWKRSSCSSWPKNRFVIKCCWQSVARMRVCVCVRESVCVWVRACALGYWLWVMRGPEGGRGSSSSGRLVPPRLL